MIRTQIQLTEQQAARVKQAASAAGASMSDVIRCCIDSYLDSQSASPSEEGLQRALAIPGRFRSGKRDGSEQHDAVLAEAFSK
jgi:hypothetical protein